MYSFIDRTLSLSVCIYIYIYIYIRVFIYIFMYVFKHLSHPPCEGTKTETVNVPMQNQYKINGSQ